MVSGKKPFAPEVTGKLTWCIRYTTKPSMIHVGLSVTRKGNPMCREVPLLYPRSTYINSRTEGG